MGFATQTNSTPTVLSFSADNSPNFGMDDAMAWVVGEGYNAWYYFDTTGTHVAAKPYEVLVSKEANSYWVRTTDGFQTSFNGNDSVLYGSVHHIAWVIGNNFNAWYYYVATAAEVPANQVGYTLPALNNGYWVKTVDAESGSGSSGSSGAAELLELQPIHASLNNWGTFHDVQGRYVLSTKGEILTFS
jgi:hypothetical protein